MYIYVHVASFVRPLGKYAEAACRVVKRLLSTGSRGAVVLALLFARLPLQASWLACVDDMRSVAAVTSFLLFMERVPYRVFLSSF